MGAKKRPPLPGRSTQQAQKGADAQEADDALVIDKEAEAKARNAISCARSHQQATISSLAPSELRKRLNKTFADLLNRGFPANAANDALLSARCDVATSTEKATNHLLLCLPRASIPEHYRAHARERASSNAISVHQPQPPSTPPQRRQIEMPGSDENVRVLHGCSVMEDDVPAPDKDVIKRLAAAEVGDSDAEEDEEGCSDDATDAVSSSPSWQPGNSDEWAIWSDDRSVEQRRKQRNRMPRADMLEQCAHELKRLKEESTHAKSQNDTGRKKRAGLLIKQLKDEMKHYGGDTEARVEERVTALEEAERCTEYDGETAHQVAFESDSEFGGIDFDRVSNSGNGQQNTSPERSRRNDSYEYSLNACEDGVHGDDTNTTAFGIDDLFDESGKMAQISQEPATREKAPTLADIAPHGEEGRKFVKRAEKEEKDKLPKAILQNEAQSQGAAAPKFERFEHPYGKAGYCYSCSHYRPGFQRSRGGKRKSGGYVKSSLDPNEDGWSSIQDAQQAAAARGLFEAHYDDEEWDASKLAEPFASLWRYWKEEQRQRQKATNEEENKVSEFVEAYMAKLPPSYRRSEVDDQIRFPFINPSNSRRRGERRLSSEVLLHKLHEREQSEAYKHVAEARKKLPILEVEDQIQCALNTSDAVVISGETGCGKTTQVPQFVYDALIRTGKGADCNLICTQPRRVAAISVAQRVAQERLEPAPGEEGAAVGYQVRLNAAVNSDTQLLFCTTGILLRRIQSDPLLQDVSHIIMDEMHERSLESDFAAALLKNVPKRRREEGLAPLKLVLMSATINADLFSSYLGGCPVVYAAGRAYSVDTHFLEDVLEKLQYVLPADHPAALESEGQDNSVVNDIAKSNQEARQLAEAWGCSSHDNVFGTVTGPNPNFKDELYKDEYSRTTRRTLAQMNEYVINFELIEALVEHLHSQLASDGAILVFLPGVGEIKTLLNRLEGSRDLGTHLILPLHASLPSDEQKRVFERPLRGTRKVVLTTNIAETSITVDDVVAVVDSGKLKEVQYYPRSGMSSLEETFVSKASAKQRAGRAGRTQPGVCYRLFTRNRYDCRFRAHQVPEIQRVPLAEVVLQVKQLAGNTSLVMDVLNEAPEPPKQETVNAALKELEEVGALSDGKLTSLGSHLATFPVDVRVGKLLVIGTLLGCCSRVLTAAAAMSTKSPFLRTEAGEQAKASFALPGKGTIASGQLSDQLVCIAAFENYKRILLANGRRRALSFCQKNALDSQTLDGMDDMRQQFATLLTDNKLIGRPRGTNGRATASSMLANAEKKDAGWNANGTNARVLRAVLGSALYANVAKKVRGKQQLELVDANGSMSIHPSSVLASSAQQQKQLATRFVAFHEKFKTKKAYVRECTAITPAMLLMFGGEIQVHHDKAQLTVDRWISIKAKAEHGALFSELRTALDEELGERIRGEERDEQQQESSIVVDAVISLLESERLNN